MAQGKIIYHNSKKELGNTPQSLVGNQGLNTRDRVTTPSTPAPVEKKKEDAVSLIARGVELLELNPDSIDATQNFILLELHKSLGIVLGVSELPKSLEEAKKAPVKRAVNTSTSVVKDASVKKRGRKPGTPNKPKQ